MAFTPLDTRLIEQRLREQVPSLQEISGTAAYLSLRELTNYPTGSAYVVLAAENNLAADTGQPRRKALASAIFGVVVCARNYRDINGDEANQFAEQVRSALIGWAPEAWTPCTWLTSQILDSDQERVLWIDVFHTTHVLGAA